MKRYFVNLAALLLGLVLGGVATYASADTLPATQQTAPSQWRATNQQPWAASAQAACDIAWPSDATTANIIDWSAASCKRSNGITQGYVYAGCPNGGNLNATGCVGAYVYTCPSGQNWTLSGTTCTRPDCAPGQQRDANGICQTVACPTGQYSSGYYQGTAPAYACASNGCGVSFTGSYPAGRDAQGNLYASGSYSYTGGNQGECTPGQAGAVAAPGTTSNSPSSTAPGSNGCAAGDGVITSSSGKVACVPSGTPGSSTPVPNKDSKTETFPDGSTKTTINNQVCTGDGACQTITTTTVTGATGGGAGQAGPIGTTTSTKEKPPSPTSSFCAENPSIQLCKGGMNEEATQKEVRDELKKLTTPNVTDDAAITGATHSAASQTALEAENLKVEQAATGIVDPTSSHKSSWLSAMESGWFAGIPQSSCTPFVSNYSGKTWTFDVCPTAAKISEWGAWAFAFMAAFMIWGMVTQQKET